MLAAGITDRPAITDCDNLGVGKHLHIPTRTNSGTLGVYYIRYIVRDGLDSLRFSLYHCDEGSSTVQLVLRTPTGDVAAPPAAYYVPDYVRRKRLRTVSTTTWLRTFRSTAT